MTADLLLVQKRLLFPLCLCLAALGRAINPFELSALLQVNIS